MSREVLPDRQLHMRFCTWRTKQEFLSYGGERTQNSKHREEELMLKELSKRNMQAVVGGLGVVYFYFDENGNLVKGSRPAGVKFGDKPRCPTYPFPKFPIRK
jgi:hypothetical protein